MGKKSGNRPQNKPNPTPSAAALATHRVNLTLPDEVFRWLQKKAALLGKSPTTYASMILMQMMMEEKTKK